MNKIFIIGKILLQIIASILIILALILEYLSKTRKVTSPSKKNTQINQIIQTNTTNKVLS